MPTRVIRGKRIGKTGRIRTGCSAVIFNDDRQKLLLTRRTDNGLWCLPGGGINSGESVAETCMREVQEETGLLTRITRLIGVYSSPDWLVEYPDGNKVQIVALSFEAVPEGGQLNATDEVSEYGYFSIAEIEKLDLMQNHYQRIIDAFAEQCEAFIR